MGWQVYLSGEIHTDWRGRIERGAAAAGLDVRLTAPVTDHAASDAAGTAILGEQERPFWNDHLGAGVNAIRTRTLIDRADVVVVRFGERYRRAPEFFRKDAEVRPNAQRTLARGRAYGVTPPTPRRLGVATEWQPDVRRAAEVAGCPDSAEVSV